MELYEITIRPEGALGTPLRGDTIFGHFCWQVAYDPSLVQDGLSPNIRRYAEQPYVIFSSAFPRFDSDGSGIVYGLKRPALPLEWLFPSVDQDRLARARERKSNKARTWMLAGSDLKLDVSKGHFLSDDELFSKIDTGFRQRPHWSDSYHIIHRCSRAHNTIHRFSGTTGPGEFAPYSQELQYYAMDISLAIFVLIDETVTDIVSVKKGLERIGKLGFGKDASIGLGRFSVVGSQQMPPTHANGCRALYCLAPTVPVPGSYTEAYFVPFVRFGKHGDTLARSDNPFKNPVIMADEGAVFVPRDKEALSQPYWGRAVANVSLSQRDAVVQGYSICLPIQIHARGDT